MSVIVVDALLTSIRRHCELLAPTEACGLVLHDPGAASGQRWLPCANTHPDPDHGFRIDPALMVTHAGKVVAVVHSHVAPAPLAWSDADLAGQAAMGLPWALVRIGADGKAEPGLLMLGTGDD